MFEVIYRTSDGEEYKTRESAIMHETRFQRKEYERALADYQYVRFGEHRFYVKNYLRYKHMTVDEFLKLSGNETLTRTCARKRLWDLREHYKNKVKEGERTIKVRKSALQAQMKAIRQEEAQMKEE